MNEWSSGRGFNGVQVRISLVQYSLKIVSDSAALNKVKNWLKSIICNVCSSMNEWSSGRGFGLTTS